MRTFRIVIEDKEKTRSGLGQWQFVRRGKRAKEGKRLMKMRNKRRGEKRREEERRDIGEKRREEERRGEKRRGEI